MCNSADINDDIIFPEASTLKGNGEIPQTQRSDSEGQWGEKYLKSLVNEYFLVNLIPSKMLMVCKFLK